MKEALMTIPMLAYLSCAAPPVVDRTPIVEISGDSVAITEVRRETIEVPKDPPGKIAADYIVKRLEEIIEKNPGTEYVSGSITINGDHIYNLDYNFDTTDLCEVGSEKPMFKESFSLHFQDWLLYVPNGTSSETRLHFETVRPFYPAKSVQYSQGVYPAHGSSTNKFGLYQSSLEIQKMHQEILLYIAEELKQTLTIELGNVISVQHQDRDFDQQKEGKLIQSYNDFKNAFPRQHPYPAGGKLTLLEPCKP